MFAAVLFYSGEVRAAIEICDLDMLLSLAEKLERHVWRRCMLSHEENETVTRVGPGTPMGMLMRRYWMPAALSRELPGPDCAPIRVRLLGERLVAFRDTSGRLGLVDEFCPHRRASLFLARNEEDGLRCVYHGWKFDVKGKCP